MVIISSDMHLTVCYMVCIMHLLHKSYFEILFMHLISMTTDFYRDYSFHEQYSVKGTLNVFLFGRTPSQPVLRLCTSSISHGTSPPLTMWLNP